MVFVFMILSSITTDNLDTFTLVQRLLLLLLVVVVVIAGIIDAVDVGWVQCVLLTTLLVSVHSFRTGTTRSTTHSLCLEDQQLFHLPSECLVGLAQCIVVMSQSHSSIIELVLHLSAFLTALAG